MRAGFPLLCVVALAFGAPVLADGVARQAPHIARSAELYARHCQGCHGHRGFSVPEVPRLSGKVGHFTAVPRGRDYLIRLPNVAFAQLDDADLARMMNWMLSYFSRNELPDEFRPFTRDEVADLRRRPLTDTMAERGRVVDELVASGEIASSDTLAFAPHPKP